MTLLRGENLVKHYGKKVVVAGVSLRVEEAEIVGLLGKNGAGKTTTFSMIMGLVRPDSGRIVFEDADVTTYPISKRARSGMGYLAQEPSIFRRMTVGDNILAVLEWMPQFSKGERLDRMTKILGEMDLLDLIDQKSYSLSGGERRRLEIARILVTEPRLILLDEPFSGVDPIAVEEIQNLVVGLRERGMGVLITDHNVRETLSITDRSYIMHEGRVLQEGRARDLVNDERVRRAYLGRSFTMHGDGSDSSGLRSPE